MASALALKLGGLFVKTLAKPVAKRLKNEAAVRPQLYAVCVSLGNWTHRASAWITVTAAGHKSLGVARLDDPAAFAKGADFLSEGFIFAVGGGVIVFEYNRSKMKEAATQAAKAERTEKFRRDLEERFTLLEKRVLELEEDRRGWVPWGKQNKTPPPSGPSFVAPPSPPPGTTTNGTQPAAPGATPPTPPAPQQPSSGPPPASTSSSSSSSSSSGGLVPSLPLPSIVKKKADPAPSAPAPPTAPSPPPGPSPPPAPAQAAPPAPPVTWWAWVGSWFGGAAAKHPPVAVAPAAPAPEAQKLQQSVTARPEGGPTTSSSGLCGKGVAPAGVVAVGEEAKEVTATALKKGLESPPPTTPKP